MYVGIQYLMFPDFIMRNKIQGSLNIFRSTAKLQWVQTCCYTFIIFELIFYTTFSNYWKQNKNTAQRCTIPQKLPS